MDQAKYSRRQAIRSAQDEIAILERDLAQKKADVANLQAEDAAAESAASLRFVETPEPAEKKSK